MTPTPSRPIALVGFSGSGKTTVARLLADALGWQLIDTDEEIAKAADMSISDMFMTLGESSFRAKEANIAQAAAMREDVVIATGGGAMIDDNTRRLYRQRCHVVLLSVTADTAWRRLQSTTDRPLISASSADAAAAQQALEALYHERRSLYGTFPHSVQTDNASPKQLAARVLTLISLIEG